MNHVIAKDELDNLKLRISPTPVIMSDGSIRMMNHAELLPLYYLIPEEILSKCGVELNRIERILSVLLSDPVAVDIVCSLILSVSFSSMGKFVKNCLIYIVLLGHQNILCILNNLLTAQPKGLRNDKSMNLET